ncbi:hypothetical protein AB3662_29425 [Sorangium cellulosum]|uniref:hypothetical protein n=1 Tax=Sorangium cellulosum TaxID=56 RepID=UPI003D9A2DE3
MGNDTVYLWSIAAGAKSRHLALQGSLVSMASSPDGKGSGGWNRGGGGPKASLAQTPTVPEEILMTDACRAGRFVYLEPNFSL